MTRIEKTPKKRGRKKGCFIWRGKGKISARCEWSLKSEEELGVRGGGLLWEKSA